RGGAGARPGRPGGAVRARAPGVAGRPGDPPREGPAAPPVPGRRDDVHPARRPVPGLRRHLRPAVPDGSGHGVRLGGTTVPVGGRGPRPHRAARTVRGRGRRSPCRAAAYRFRTRGGTTPSGGARRGGRHGAGTGLTPCVSWEGPGFPALPGPRPLHTVRAPSSTAPRHRSGNPVEGDAVNAVDAVDAVAGLAREVRGASGISPGGWRGPPCRGPRHPRPGGGPPRRRRCRRTAPTSR